MRSPCGSGRDENPAPVTDGGDRLAGVDISGVEIVSADLGRVFLSRRPSGWCSLLSLTLLGAAGATVRVGPSPGQPDVRVPTLKDLFVPRLVRAMRTPSKRHGFFFQPSGGCGLLAPGAGPAFRAQQHIPVIGLDVAQSFPGAGP